MLRRLPIESAEPAQLLAAFRLVIAAGSLLLTLALGLPYDAQLAAVLALGAVPWALALLLLAARDPKGALHPMLAAGDVAVLAVVELVVPETFGAVRLAAVFFFSVHAHFQGERRGLAIAAGGVATLVLATAVRGDTPVTGSVLAFYEASSRWARR